MVVKSLRRIAGVREISFKMQKYGNIQTFLTRTRYLRSFEFSIYPIPVVEFVLVENSLRKCERLKTVKIRIEKNLR